ncbi:MAG: HutD family protein [Firmicutes bacterium]|nr:HutD family protein [Bacillota bacterium]
MDFFKINDVNISSWDGGSTEEFFIYPVGSNYANRDFSIRVSRANVDKVDGNFTHLPDYKRFLIPISKDLMLEINGGRMLIKKETTFSFDGSEKIISKTTGSDFNLMLKKDMVGKMEVLKFKDKLIIRDDIKQNKILFFYNLRDNIKLSSANKEMELCHNEFGVAITRDKYEMVINPSTSDNCIIWGKVSL